MTVRELEEYLKSVKDKEKSIYVYREGEDFYEDSDNVLDAVEVMESQQQAKMNGVYIKID